MKVDQPATKTEEPPCALEEEAFFEPTDVRKAVKPFLSDAWRHLSIVSPNLAELRAMHAALESVLGTSATTAVPEAPTEEVALEPRVSTVEARAL
ncbi:hypothetical protein HPB49_008589 [Dermacentor silvarum]|uniref:Uncharacterized protein n=1 Tax=Dermacentor silvarum TaxID=543639 RepID=A0ACB8CWD2_DERSI|nr:hypothetical protein HPB49_008589 [Dermacentor silvarum]